MNEDSLLNVWAAINAAGGTKEVNISKTMIHAVRNARSYYHEALEQAKKDDQEKLKSAETPKRVCEQLKELKEKNNDCLKVLCKKPKLLMKKFLNSISLRVVKLLFVL